MSGSEQATPPPDGLPCYRVLTGEDNAAFCHRVAGELARGYRLYGPPSVTFNGQFVVVAQAVVWPGPLTTPAAAGP